MGWLFSRLGDRTGRPASPPQEGEDSRPATKPKHEALNDLAEYIAEHTGKLAKQGESISTFAELWKAFCAVKSGQWSKKTRENLKCLFAKHVNSQIASQRMRDVTFDAVATARQ